MLMASSAKAKKRHQKDEEEEEEEESCLYSRRLAYLSPVRPSVRPSVSILFTLFFLEEEKEEGEIFFRFFLVIPVAAFPRANAN